ncbi:glycosyltransferase [Polynucleobacter paneuropaeus]|nr:glycosyltransferase [Polynucleobacter paneuropaeus]
MTQKIYILSHVSEHTTAHSFARAFSEKNISYHYYDRIDDLSILLPADILFLVDPVVAWPIGLEEVNCKIIAYFIDVHLELGLRMQQAQFADIVFIAQKDYVNEFKEAGILNVHWMPLAFDPYLLSKELIQNGRSIDLGFIGKLGRPGSRRFEVLSKCLGAFKSNDYLTYTPPRQMIKIYQRSKIVINASIKGDLNMRVFEAMGAGALLITDRIENGLTELFSEGVHYIGYSELEEAQENIAIYLADEQLRVKISNEGTKLVMANHLYWNRWISMMHIHSNSNPVRTVSNFSEQRVRKITLEVLIALRSPKEFMKVIGRYGFHYEVIRYFFLSNLRLLNTVIPITPNALIKRFELLLGRSKKKDYEFK